jgi:hypothetical protein
VDFLYLDSLTGCLFIVNCREHLLAELRGNLSHAVVRLSVFGALLHYFVHSLTARFKVAVHAYLSATDYLCHFAPPCSTEMSGTG